MTAIRNATPQEVLDAVSDDGDPAQRPWSQEQMLLASIADAVRQLGWMFASVHSKERRPAPEPIGRPGVRVKQRKPMTVAQYRALTGQEPPLHLIRGGRPA